MAECFAFFCEDFRTEIGGKTSYMGVLGPQIVLEKAPSGDESVKEVIEKLVVVAMIRTDRKGDLPLKSEVIFENAPEGVREKIKNDHMLEVKGDFATNLVQFHAQMPHVPAHPGMKITVNFFAEDTEFSAELSMKVV